VLADHPLRKIRTLVDPAPRIQSSAGRNLPFSNVDLGLLRLVGRVCHPTPVRRNSRLPTLYGACTNGFAAEPAFPGAAGGRQRYDRLGEHANYLRGPVAWSDRRRRAA
jgi:hypothetical protein